jgi:HAD superfamily hydrolase (TIGR01450 family)
VALVDELDGLLVDLDGVVWLGREPVPGSAEALIELGERELPLVFVTNNPGRPAATYAARLRESGIAVEDDHVVTAGEAAARLAGERAGAGAQAFVIGPEALKEAVSATGLDPVSGERGNRAEIVIVAGHRGFDYEELLTATMALRGGAALVATSRDPTLPMPGGAWPGTGAILAAVETASGASAEIAGKPERHLFDLARSRIGDGRRIAIVGDRVASDIEGGRRAGLETILVLTGASAAEDAEQTMSAADHVVADLAELVR